MLPPPIVPTDRESRQPSRPNSTPRARSLRRLSTEVPFASDYGAPVLWPNHSWQQYFIAIWKDLVFMANCIVASLLLLYYPIRFPSTRKFPIWIVDGKLVGPKNISHEYRRLIFPLAGIWVVVILAPILVILLFQIALRSMFDATVGVLGLGNAILVVVIFSTVLNKFVGGYRPHFLDLCKPSLKGHKSASGVFHMDKHSCTGTNKKLLLDAVQSFPSIHTAVAFAAAIFLTLYLNGKLKPFAHYSPVFWKVIVLFVPFLVACMIVGELVLDKYNHVVDVVFGALLGTMVAFLSYRSYYAAVFNYRFNHVPYVFETGRRRFPCPAIVRTWVRRWRGQDTNEPIELMPRNRSNSNNLDGANDGAADNNRNNSDSRRAINDEEGMIGSLYPFNDDSGVPAVADTSSRETISSQATGVAGPSSGRHGSRITRMGTQEDGMTGALHTSHDSRAPNGEADPIPNQTILSQDTRVAGSSSERCNGRTTGRGKHRATDEEVEAMGSDPNFNSTGQGSAHRPPLYLDPPIGSADRVAPSFIAQETGPSNAGGGSPVETIGTETLEDAETRIAAEINFIDAMNTRFGIDIRDFAPGAVDRFDDTVLSDPGVADGFRENSPNQRWESTTVDIDGTDLVPIDVFDDGQGRYQRIAAPPPYSARDPTLSSAPLPFTEPTDAEIEEIMARTDPVLAQVDDAEQDVDLSLFSEEEMASFASAGRELQGQGVAAQDDAETTGLD